MSREEVARKFDAIVDFSEIREFIDTPVKRYSSGMYVRLAFSTAIHVDPEILIVDEALAVGDAVFANRCVKKFDELKAKGVTVLFVSHDLALVKRLCDRAALMVDGRMVACGMPKDVVNRYMAVILEKESKEKENKEAGRTSSGTISGASFRHGDGASRVLEVALLNAEGEKVDEIEPGAAVRIRVQARAERDVERMVMGVLIRNRQGIDVWGTNTVIEGVDFGKLSAGESFEIDFGFECSLTRHEYTITVATQYPEGHSQDWLDDAVAFRVVDAHEVAGLARFKTKVEWRRLGGQT
jgi:lipopolysaccharide transport system ATP-binding protein